MAAKIKTRQGRKVNEVINNPIKPTLIQVGRHFINVEDVIGVKAVKKGTLFIVMLRSQPNPEYPLWAKPEEIEILMTHFNIITHDANDEDED